MKQYRDSITVYSTVNILCESREWEHINEKSKGTSVQLPCK